MRQFEELDRVLMEAKQQVEVGALYFHYRSPGQSYKVLSLALDEATEEPCVVYQALYGSQLIWVRSVKAWCECLDYKGQLVSRFIKILER
jgi:hypothetical protein